LIGGQKIMQNKYYYQQITVTRTSPIRNYPQNRTVHLTGATTANNKKHQHFVQMQSPEQLIDRQVSGSAHFLCK